MGWYGVLILLGAVLLALSTGDSAPVKLARITHVAFQGRAILAWDDRNQELWKSDFSTHEWSARRLPFRRLYGLTVQVPNALLILAHFPNNEGVVQLLRSTDDGETWQPFGSGLPRVLDFGQQSIWTNAFVQHPYQPTRLCILTEGVLLFSNDGGKRWRALQTPQLARVFRLELRGKRGEILYAWQFSGEEDNELIEVLLSKDEGQSWKILGENIDDAVRWGATCVLGVHPKNPSILLGYDVVDVQIVQETGTLAVVKSRDFGTHWNIQRIGDARTFLLGSRGWHAPADAEAVESFQFVRILPDPDGDGMTFSNGYGIYRKRASEDFPGQRVLTVRAWEPVLLLERHPSVPGLLLASGLGGFFLSRDSGRTWVHVRFTE